MNSAILLNSLSVLAYEPYGGCGLPSGRKAARPARFDTGVVGSCSEAVEVA